MHRVLTAPLLKIIDKRHDLLYFLFCSVLYFAIVVSRVNGEMTFFAFDCVLNVMSVTKKKGIFVELFIPSCIFLYMYAIFFQIAILMIFFLSTKHVFWVRRVKGESD